MKDIMLEMTSDHMKVQWFSITILIVKTPKRKEWLVGRKPFPMYELKRYTDRSKILCGIRS